MQKKKKQKDGTYLCTEINLAIKVNLLKPLRK